MEFCEHSFVWYLCGSPVDPAFAIGINVEQNQTFHQVGEDQLKPKKKKKAELTHTSKNGASKRAGSCGFTYGKFSQDVSSSSNSNPNNALEPKSSIDSLDANFKKKQIKCWPVQREASLLSATEA